MADLYTKRALVLSPSSTHPPDHGNRNRVRQTANFLKNSGYEVTFVLYPIESDWQQSIPAEREEMKAAWDDLVVIPPSKLLHQKSIGEHHEIDEWWDVEIENYLKWIFKRRYFDVVFVNYTYLSKAFEFAPSQSLKILDTHDVFSGRKELFAAHGVEPEFFYTTLDREVIAFNRADILLAIKDSERDFIQKQTDLPVVSLPYFHNVDRIDIPASVAEAGEQMPSLRVGFIGAENSVNIVNMREFLREFEELSAIYVPPVEILVAGNVCKGLWSASPAVKLMGRVNDIREFYDSVDVIVTPLAFSTGIKIKVGEALGFEKPVISTANGFDGYPVCDSFHHLPDMRAVCKAVINVSFDRARLDLLAENTRMTGKLAALNVSAGFRLLSRYIQEASFRVLFITDQPFWLRSSPWQERIYQWFELFTFLHPCICCFIGSEERHNFPKAGTLGVGFVAFPRGETLVREISAFYDEIGRCCTMVAISDGPVDGVVEVAAARSDYLVVDRWRKTGDPATGLPSFAVDHDLHVLVPDGIEPGISTSPLRYLPRALMHWSNSSHTQTEGICVVSTGDGGVYRTETEYVVRRLRSARGGQVFTVGCEMDDQTGAHDEFYSWSSKHKRPELMVLVGPDGHYRRLYRDLARYLSLPCEIVGPDILPSAHQDRSVPPRDRMVVTLSELMDAILSSRKDSPLREAHDAGWSRLWKILEKA